MYNKKEGDFQMKQFKNLKNIRGGGGIATQVEILQQN